MKIRQQTPDRLRITGFPYGLALGLLAVIGVPVVMSVGLLNAGQTAGGLFMAAIAVLMLFGCFGVFVRHREFVLDRRAETITVTERGVLGVKRTTRSIKGLQGASIQTRLIPQPAKSGRNPPDLRLCRPVLVFGPGRTEPVYEMFANDSDASAIASAINGWVGGFGTPEYPTQP